jgi:hypothetical protein
MVLSILAWEATGRVFDYIEDRFTQQDIDL